MKEYKTVTQEVDGYDDVRKFDKALNSYISKGWLLAGQIQTSTLNKGSFLGHYPTTVLTQRLEREITEETLIQDAKDKEEQKRIKDLAQKEQGGLKLYMILSIYVAALIYLIINYIS